MIKNKKNLFNYEHVLNEILKTLKNPKKKIVERKEIVTDNKGRNLSIPFVGNTY